MIANDVRGRFLRAIRAGMTRSVAARCAGLHPGTVRAWTTLARSGEEPYASFIRDVARAEAEVLAACGAAIMKAVDAGDAGTALKFLAARLPKAFGTRTRVELKSVDSMSEGEVRRELAGIMARLDSEHLEETAPQIADVALGTPSTGRVLTSSLANENAS